MWAGFNSFFFILENDYISNVRNALGFSWAKFSKLYKDYMNSRQTSAACKNCK